jgi:transcriptional/translational regulatory protein YebC/TACO1
VRHAFSKQGGNMGTDGSVAYLFTKMGILNFAPGTPEEAIMDIALEAGADDVVTEEDGSIEVHTAPEAFDEVVAAMEAGGFEPANSEITMRASTEVELDVETGQKVLRLLDILEDLDDAQAVYSNADIPDEAYED